MYRRCYFMDLREKIIESVMEKLQNRVPEDVQNIVQDTLVIELNKYEVQNRCTEVAVVDNSIEGIMKKFIATKRVEGIAESTLRRYAYENMRLLRFLNKEIYKITTYDIRFYLSYKRDKGKKKLSNRTLDGMRRCYSSFFGWLSAEGIIGKNPCATLKQIKYKKKIKKPYTASEMERIRRSCKTLRDIALVELLYCTGCRVSEIEKLDISDINFDTMDCIVDGKGKKERYVYLSEVAAMHLKEYLESRTDTSEALFSGKGTDRLHKGGIEAALKKIGAAAGVETVHPHKYRRTLATNLLDRGMNIQDVATLLGHSDLKTTQIYCFISQQNVRNAYNKFAA